MGIFDIAKGVILIVFCVVIFLFGMNGFVINPIVRTLPDIVYIIIMLVGVIIAIYGRNLTR